MRYINRTGCKSMRDRGENKEIKSMGALTRTATKIAEENGLGLLKTHWGAFKVISASGLGAYSTELKSLEEVDAFIKNLDAHKAERI